MQLNSKKISHEIIEERNKVIKIFENFKESLSKSDKKEKFVFNYNEFIKELTSYYYEIDSFYSFSKAYYGSENTALVAKEKSYQEFLAYKKTDPKIISLINKIEEINSGKLDIKDLL